MNKFVIDAYAWIEYFKGTVPGEKVKNIVEDSNNLIYTNVITIAELSSFFERKDSSFKEAKKLLISLSSPIPINTEFADEAGKLHAELKKKIRHIGLADILVLLTAKKLNAKVVTGDEDFRDLKETYMIK
ncbi:MAG: PIN domain-containing protein [Nanoarchaeota archaeon]